jgi:hypothetical protein
MMLYLANPSTGRVRAAIAGLKIAAIITPRQGNRLPAGGWYAVDNGCGPGKGGKAGAGYPGDEAFLRLLMDLDAEDGADPCDPDQARCLFAVAPDVVGDAAATLARSERFLPLIRHYTSFPAAFVGQNGQEHLPVPWDDFDVLFLGGSAECPGCRYVRPLSDLERQHCPSCGGSLAEWKLGQAARDLTAQARALGKPVHMGRVNSLKRLRYAEAIGCDSADGTYVAVAPDKNLPVVLGWDRAINGQATLWGA